LFQLTLLNAKIEPAPLHACLVIGVACVLDEDMGVCSIPLMSVGRGCMMVSGLEAGGALGTEFWAHRSATSIRGARGHPRHGLRVSQGTLRCGATACVCVLLSFWSLSGSQRLTAC